MHYGKTFKCCSENIDYYVKMISSITQEDAFSYKSHVATLGLRGLADKKFTVKSNLSTL